MFKRIETSSKGYYMFSVGDCNIPCVESNKFINTVVTQDYVFNITEITNYEDQKYCIQLGCLNSSVSANQSTLTQDDLKDAIKSYYYEQQLIGSDYIGYNINIDNITTISSNEDVFIKQHYDAHHMNYHINSRYATDSESANPENDFVIQNSNKIGKISIGNYYIDSEHFEFYSRYIFDPEYHNFHFKMVLQIGIYFIIFEFIDHTKLTMKFASFYKSKLDVFYSKMLYDFSNTSISTAFALNVENKYNESTRVTLSLNDNTNYTFEIEEYLLPFTLCTVVSNMYVEYRGHNLITVRSNLDQDSTYLYSNNSYENKELKYDLTIDDILSDDYPNLIFNIGCKYEFDDNLGDRTFNVKFGEINSSIKNIQLLAGNQTKVYSTNLARLNVRSQSTLFKSITLIDQDNYIQSIVVDDTTKGYHSLNFTQEETYLAFYKYQWNAINACYGFKERYTIKGLELFKRIEAYSAKYSIYGLNFNISPNLDSISPNTSVISPDYTGNSFQTTNIIPLEDLDEVQYISSDSYRHIEIQAVLKDLRSKFNLDDNVKSIYLTSVTIVYIENNSYFELATNANHTMKVINVDDDLPVILSIEY